jgi:hypothetical protein
MGLTAYRDLGLHSYLHIWWPAKNFTNNNDVNIAAAILTDI